MHSYTQDDRGRWTLQSTEPAKQSAPRRLSHGDSLRGSIHSSGGGVRQVEEEEEEEGKALLVGLGAEIFLL